MLRLKSDLLPNKSILIHNNAISDSNEDTTLNVSDPVSANCCITLVWAEQNHYQSVWSLA